jgi:hypothetical protein
VQSFIDRYKDSISGSLSCIDRLVFRGYMRSIQYVEGFEKYLHYQRVLYKDFAQYASSAQLIIKNQAIRTAEENGRPYEYLTSPKQSKEKKAREIAERDGIEEGLVCTFGCVELSPTFRMFKNREKRILEIRSAMRQHLHMYYYLMDREFGLMYVRIQTWFPFKIQIGINGHEYLARQLDRAGIEYEKHDNCLTRIADMKKAQQIADRLLKKNWPRVLNSFAKRANPFLDMRRRDRIGNYYWIVHQSEYSTNIMFRSPEALAAAYPRLCRHAMTNFDTKHIMRFLGKRMTCKFEDESTGHYLQRPEGVCIKHWVGKNSIKMYDKAGMVLRVETTINDSRAFCIYREDKRKRMPMRMGVADLRQRVDVSHFANKRYLDALSAVSVKTPSYQLLDRVSKRVKKKNKNYRAVRPIDAEEARFFRAIHCGENLLRSFSNGDIQSRLHESPPRDKREARIRSNHVGRRLRLFRAHGLIRKLSRSRRYRLTRKGIMVMATVLEFRKEETVLLDIAS